MVSTTNGTRSSTNGRAQGVKKVAVIGAGASGLTAIKELLKRGFQVTAFEAKPQVGGAWIYNPEPPGQCVVEFDRDGRPVPMTLREAETSRHASSNLNGEASDRRLHGDTNPMTKGASPEHDILLDPSPMYRLRTNIPCNLMSYRDFAFKETSGPFPRDDEVLHYLEEYANEVLPYIRFSTLIKRIHKDSEGDQMPAQWTVETARTQRGDHTEQEESMQVERFDAICDCSGHYTRPYIPFVPGLWDFKNELLHAKWYRTPDAFADKNVLVVGNSASGYDVGHEIATFFRETNSARKVYQSIRHGFEIGIDPSEGPVWASHLELLPGIARVLSDTTVEFLDGRRLDFDTIIFATGYLYSFPYYHAQDTPFDQHPLTSAPSLPTQKESADGSCEAVPGRGVTVPYPVGGLQVRNLDREFQTFYHPDPTLAIICLNKSVVPFGLAQVQSHAVAKYWSGDAELRLKPDDTTGEDPNYHKYGAPKEFDVADALLRAVGEGQELNISKQDQPEILPDGSFPATAAWRRQQRPECKSFRREVLGY